MIREPNYRRKLAEMAARGELVKPGKIGLADVLHDDWCAALSGGVCRCDPEIRVKWVADPRCN